jgi:hypothetical protein
MTRQKLIKDPKITDFYITEYIAWDEIKRVLGKRRYKKFSEFMMGQTVSENGAYVCDVANFLRKKCDRFFD